MERADWVSKTCGTTSRVDDHVHIGGYLAAADPDYVKAHKFTHILKLFSDDRAYPGGYHRHPDITYLVIDAEDTPDYPFGNHFARCLEFVQKAIREDGQILVHCHAGVSRSATIVLLHLMINSGRRLIHAWKHLKKVRPVVHPNPGFRKLLIDIDARAARFRHTGLAPPRPKLTS